MFTGFIIYMSVIYRAIQELLWLRLRLSVLLFSMFGDFHYKLYRNSFQNVHEEMSFSELWT